jgi:hypothetical protein
MTFTINAYDAAKLLPFPSTEAHRPILNTLACLSGGRLCATDGHTLGMFWRGHDAPDEVLLSATKDLARLVKLAAGKKGSGELTVTLPADPDAAHAYVESDSMRIAVPTVDGPYPVVSNVFPWADEPAPLPSIGLNGKYLERFGEKARLTFYGPVSAVVVRTPDERFIGLVIPLTLLAVTDAPDTLPAWIRGLPVHEPANI